MDDPDPTKPARRARRRLVAALTSGAVAGHALPRRWTRPVVERVVLPAHAQASPAAGEQCGSGSPAQVVVSTCPGLDTPAWTPVLALSLGSVQCIA